MFPPGPGIDIEALGVEAGLREVASVVSVNHLSRVLGGMLLDVAERELPLCSDDESRRLCQAKVLVIRDFRRELVRILEGS